MRWLWNIWIFKNILGQNSDILIYTSYSSVPISWLSSIYVNSDLNINKKLLLEIQLSEYFNTNNIQYTVLAKDEYFDPTSSQIVPRVLYSVRFFPAGSLF